LTNSLKKKEHYLKIRHLKGGGGGGGGIAGKAVLRIRIRIRSHYSEVWIRFRILVWIRIRILVWIRILLSSCKNSKKNLDSYYFVTLFDCLSLKN